ncbi:ATP-binding protein [Lactococcus garvieae]
MKRKYSDIIAYHENMVLKENGNVYAIFEVPSVILSRTDDQAKENAKSIFESTIEETVPYQAGQLLDIPMTLEVFKMYQILSEDLSEDTKEMAFMVLNESLDKLEREIGDVEELRHFLVFPLRNLHISTNLSKTVKSAVDFYGQSLVGAMGKDYYSEDWFTQFEELNHTLESILMPFDAKSLTEKQTIYVTRWQAIKGLPHVKEHEINLVMNSANNLEEVEVEYFMDGVYTLKNQYGKTFNKALVVSYNPNNVSYFHLAERLDILPFSVPKTVLWRFSSKRGWFSVLNRAVRARTTSKNAQDEAYEKDSVQESDVATSVFIQEDTIRRTQAGETYLDYLMVIDITASSKEELEWKQDALMRETKAIDVQLSPATADQPYLYHKMRIGEELTSKDKNWVQPMSLAAFSENLFFVSSKIGFDVGFYMGRIDDTSHNYNSDFNRALSNSNKPFFLNIFALNEKIVGKQTDNPTLSTTGETGSGKSFFNKLCFTYMSLMLSKMLYIDPKDEMKPQYRLVYENYKKAEKPPMGASQVELSSWERKQIVMRYIEKIDFISLNASHEENKGALDPIVFLKGDDAIELSKTLIAHVLPDRYKKIEFDTALPDYLDEFLEKRKNGEKVGLLSVLEAMTHDKEKIVRDVAKYFLKNGSRSTLSLVFSHGENNAISLESRITVLGVQGLTLPKDTKSMSESEKNSMAVMYALGYFCSWFGKRNRHEKTATIFDEAWFLEGSEIGASILKEKRRTGRSYDDFTLQASQSVKDKDESDDETSFGMLACFKEPNEVDEILKLLKVPVDEKSQKWVSTMSKGQAIIKDPFGRVARVTIDGVVPEMCELFKTKDDTLKSARNLEVA